MVVIFFDDFHYFWEGEKSRLGATLQPSFGMPLVKRVRHAEESDGGGGGEATVEAVAAGYIVTQIVAMPSMALLWPLASSTYTSGVRIITWRLFFVVQAGSATTPRIRRWCQSLRQPARTASKPIRSEEPSDSCRSECPRFSPA